MGKKQEIKRGDIFLVAFDPAQGSEIKKKRPALIIQNDIANEFSSVTIVAAISSGVDKKLYPTEVAIVGTKNSLEVDSRILLSQIRTVDKNRLLKKIGTVKPEVLSQVDVALKISLSVN